MTLLLIGFIIDQAHLREKPFGSGTIAARKLLRRPVDSCNHLGTVQVSDLILNPIKALPAGNLLCGL